MTNQTNASPGIRIRPWPVKLAYIAAGCAAVYLIAGIPVGPTGAGILRSALAFVLILVAGRIFRGVGEEYAATRPLWRMTGGVQSGVLLGSFFALVAIISATGYVGVSLSSLAKQSAPNLPALLVNTVLSAILAYLYFRSARRLVVDRREKLIELARKGH